MIRRLLIATMNPGKVREMRRLLAELPIEIATPAEVGTALDVDETGSTFEENAAIKASAFARASGLPAVADDSGLVVDALGGRPGVHSATYAGLPRDDERNRRLVLAEMEGAPEGTRSARFVCVVALADPAGGAPRFFRGECEGRIARVQAGSVGFGYDPVFVPLGETRTFAEMSPSEKDAVSHRGMALRALADFFLL